MKKNVLVAALFTALVTGTYSQTNTFPATGSAGIWNLNVDASVLAAGL